MANGHHLILGELTDFITAKPLPDTHDERYRQAIARLLVNDKGYGKDEIVPQHPLEIRVDGKCARVPVTFAISLDARISMLVHYGPGSLVTRHRPALAMGRLVAPYQVPMVVVTNGEKADILDGVSGKVLNQGLGQMPHRQTLEELVRRFAWPRVTGERAEIEARIVMAFEVDDRCPCDDTVCTY